MPTKIPRPASGDVVQLILDDHRLFETLLRQIRDETQDRETLRHTLADVLVAHEEAEEEHVYPKLVRKDAIDEEQAEHGVHEHDEANQALLEVLEAEDTASEDFGEAVEDLTKALAHHMDEEERTILNPARTDVAEQTRTELGERFATERIRLMDGHCGDVSKVRELVENANGDRS